MNKKDELASEKWEKLSAVRKDVEKLSADDLKDDTTFRRIVVRLLFLCFSELYAISYRLKDK